MTSELVTNAITHARTNVIVCVERTGSHVQVTVTDFGRGMPVIKRPPPNEETGRGLLIIDELSNSWGVEGACGTGKRVWFRLETGERIDQKVVPPDTELGRA